MVRTINAPIMPMKSAPCGPNWSFATSQGKLVEGRWQSQRFGWFGVRRRALVHSPCDGIAGVLITPVCLGLLTARRLTLRTFAGSLPASHSRIRPEPPATDGARSLPGLGHRDVLSSSSRVFARPQVYGISSESLGHFWRAEVGQFWKAPKLPGRTPMYSTKSGWPTLTTRLLSWSPGWVKYFRLMLSRIAVYFSTCRIRKPNSNTSSS